MLKYKPTPYVTWIKHLSDYKPESEILIERDECFEILVHPGHKHLCIPKSDKLYRVVDREDKTIQLYFYSLAWIIPVLTQGDHHSVDAALGIVESIISIAPEEERSGAWNMLWDDHAVCERLCVIIELLKNTSILLDTNRDKFQEHLEKTYRYIVKLVSSERWLNNNHRLFHLLASFVYHHSKGDSEKIDEFAGHISNFCRSLIDIETGFAREQCISYCFFDIDVVGKVIKTLSLLSVRVDFDFDKCHKNLLHHVNAIAFPDSSLPACGDTPYGLKLSSFQSKHAIEDSVLHEHWERLECLGYYRGESPEKSVQFLMLSHNGESAHGHYSPLHTDLWFSNFGAVLVDCGGPYSYGDKERYNWFRASRGHNALSIDGLDSLSVNDIKISTSSGRDGVVGFVNYSNSSHGRSIKTNSESFLINDFVFSANNWRVYYNFAPGLSLKFTGNNSGEMILANRYGRKILVQTTSENIIFDIETTKRCVGHSKFEYGPTLALSSSSCVSHYSIKFTRVNT